MATMTSTRLNSTLMDVSPSHSSRIELVVQRISSMVESFYPYCVNSDGINRPPVAAKICTAMTPSQIPRRPWNPRMICFSGISLPGLRGKSKSTKLCVAGGSTAAWERSHGTHRQSARRTQTYVPSCITPSANEIFFLFGFAGVSFSKADRYGRASPPFRSYLKVATAACWA